MKYTACNSLGHHFPLYIVSSKLHHPLGHGWTIFVAQELKLGRIYIYRGNDYLNYCKLYIIV